MNGYVLEQGKYKLKKSFKKEEKMSRHQIKEIDVNTIFKVNITGSYGNGSNKSLNMHVHPINKEIWFSVIDHNVEYDPRLELHDAIDLYNRLK